VEQEQSAAAEASSPPLGLAYPLTAFCVSAFVSVGAALFCLGSPVGCPAPVPFLPRFVAALLFGVWAGWMRLRGRAAAGALLSFAVPSLLFLTLMLVLALFTPRDPANLPFLGALLGLSLGDAFFWVLGWFGAARFRVRRLARG